MTSRITKQEGDILLLRIGGKSLQEVAEELQVSKTTVYRWEQVALIKLAWITGKSHDKVNDLYHRARKLYGGKMI